MAPNALYFNDVYHRSMYIPSLNSLAYPVYFNRIADGTYCDIRKTADRIRALNREDCEPDGELRCTGEGRRILVCDQEGFVDLGAVTRCGAACVGVRVLIDDGEGKGDPGGGVSIAGKIMEFYGC